MDVYVHLYRYNLYMRVYTTDNDIYIKFSQYREGQPGVGHGIIPCETVTIIIMVKTMQLIGKSSGTMCFTSYKVYVHLYRCSIMIMGVPAIAHAHHRVGQQCQNNLTLWGVQ